MKHLISVVAALMLMFSTSAFAEKPSWAGKDKPNSEEVESHVEEMKSKHKNKMKEKKSKKEKKLKKDKDRHGDSDSDSDGGKKDKKNKDHDDSDDDSDKDKADKDSDDSGDHKEVMEDHGDAPNDGHEDAKAEVTEALNESKKSKGEAKKRSWKFWEN